MAKDLAYHGVIYSSNIRTVENYIHFLLEKYNIKDEVFKIEVNEAIAIINTVINMIHIVQINNSSERNLKLKQVRQTFGRFEKLWRKRVLRMNRRRLR